MQITPNINLNSSQTNLLNNNPQSFTSRNKFLRELSDISLLTQRELPVCSSTKLSRHTLIGGTYNLYRYAVDFIQEIRDFVNYEGPKDKAIVRLIDCMKRFKAGNCGEIADASYVACKMNGIDNVKIMSLGKYNTKTKKVTLIDHAVLGINFSEKSRVATEGCSCPVYINDKKGIIMDNWKGMVDYEHNATTQYKNDKFWGKTLNPDEKFCYVDCQRLDGLTDKDVVYFTEAYPNLLTYNSKTCRNTKSVIEDKSEYDFQPMRASVKERCRQRANLRNSMSRDEISRLEIRENSESNVLNLDFNESLL